MKVPVGATHINSFGVFFMFYITWDKKYMQAIWITQDKEWHHTEKDHQEWIFTRSMMVALVPGTELATHVSWMGGLFQVTHSEPYLSALQWRKGKWLLSRITTAKVKLQMVEL